MNFNKGNIPPRCNLAFKRPYFRIDALDNGICHCLCSSANADNLSVWNVTWSRVLVICQSIYQVDDAISDVRAYDWQMKLQRIGFISTFLAIDKDKCLQLTYDTLRLRPTSAILWLVTSLVTILTQRTFGTISLLVSIFFECPTLHPLWEILNLMP